jgi:hypothetical protein
MSDRFTTIERTIGSDLAGGWMAIVGLGKKMGGGTPKFKPKIES